MDLILCHLRTRLSANLASIRDISPESTTGSPERKLIDVFGGTEAKAENQRFEEKKSWLKN